MPSNTPNKRNRLIALTACGAILTGLIPSFIATSSAHADTATTEIFNSGATWKYLDTGVAQDPSWVTPTFDDDSWKSGASELGYGDGDEATVVEWGGTAGNKSPTTYFRKDFTVADASKVQSVDFQVKRDDGIVVHVNGTEVGRNRMPTGPVSHATFADADAADDGKNWRTITVPTSALTTGENTIAVEIHQAAPNSSDLTFDAKLSLTETVAEEPTPATEEGFTAGSTWKFLDAGNTPAAGWTGNDAFDDTSWRSGVGEFGYGDGDEATLVNWSGTSSNKNTTTFFRKQFNVVDASDVESVDFQVKRDDGVVVYVNGAEVGRSNMPTGEVTPTTFATKEASDDGANWQTVSIPASALSAGENTIAVEVHQATAGSSDLSFDAKLALTKKVAEEVPTGNGFTAGSTWKFLDAGNTPAAGWTANNTFDVSNWRTGVGQFGYGDGDEATLVNWSGTSSNKNTTTFFRKQFNVENAAQATSATLRVKRDDGVVVYVNGAEVGRNNMPTGEVTPTTLATTEASDDGKNWQTINVPVSALTTGTNTIAVEVHQATTSSSDLSFDAELEISSALPNEMVDAFVAGTTWKFLDAGNTPAAGWTSNSAFDDAAWRSGVGEFGYGDGDEATLVNWSGTASNKNVTTFFRKKFEVEGADRVVGATLRVKRDDGIVVYVNGAEVGRNLMPEGEITSTTLASRDASDDGTIWRDIQIPAAALVEGENTVAVEIHQATANSSDLTFDASLSYEREALPAIPTSPWVLVTANHSYKESSGVEQVGSSNRYWFTEDYNADKPGAVYLQNADGTVTSWVRFGEDLPTDYIPNRPVGTVDVEAIAIHDGYMYVADIGDAYNARAAHGVPARPYQTITRFPFPEADALAPGENVIPASSVEQVRFTYSRFGVNGANNLVNGFRNAESFAIDPATGDMVVIEKRGDANNVNRVWKVPANWGNTTPVEAPQVGSTTAGAFAFSDAAVSPDGKTAWLRDGTKVYKYPIGVGETLSVALSRAAASATTLPAQPQGEGLTVDSTGRYLIVQTEGLNKPYHGVPLP